VVVRTVEGTVELSNAGDVGVQTTVRLQPVVRIRVARGVAELPEPEEGQHRYELARIVRRPGATVIDTAAITDLRQTRVNLAEVAARMEAVEDLRVRPHFDPADPFTPPGARVNEEVTLHGRNFDVLPVTVRFGSSEVSVPREAVTPTSLRVKVPPNTPDGPVTVGITTGGGTAAAARQFEVNGDLPEPVLTDFVPANGLAGDPVTLHGRNFNVAGLEVTFGNRKADGPVANADGTVIDARVPGDLQGAVTIKVTTAGGSTTLPTPFPVGRPPAFGPRGQQLSPPRPRPNSQVTVKGTHLTGVQTVAFVPKAAPGTPVPATDFTVVSDVSLTVKIPASLPLGTQHFVRLGGVVGAPVTRDDVLTIDQI
jgi:hypothetical protein